MARAYKRKLELDFKYEDGDNKRRKLQEKLDYLDRTIRFMSGEIEKGNQTIINITGDNAEKRRDIEILIGQLNESKQETERANNLIQSLNDKLTTLQESQDETWVENTELNKQITDLEEQINNATNERDHYQGLSDEAQIRINELSQQIDENNTKIAALDKQTKLINAQLTSAQEERDSLREELDNITGEFETLKTNYSAVQSENETLKDTYNTLKKNYKAIEKENIENERLSREYYDHYNDALSSIANLKEKNKLLVTQASDLNQNIAELKNNAKLRESLIKSRESRIADLERQKEGYEGKMEQAESELMDLRGKLTTVQGELSNKKTEYQQKVAAVSAQLQQRANDEINKLNMKQANERAKLENNIRKLQEKLETANTNQALALERAKREEMIKLQNLEDKYTTAHSKLYREYESQQEQLKATIAEKTKLEREIAKNEKILSQLEASKNELKDAKMQAQELKRKWGDSVQLQKDIASLEEQKIQLEADKKTYKKELEALKKAQQQLNSRLPRGIPKSIPSSLEIPPLLETAPRPPSARQRAPQATTYNLPQLPNNNLPPPTYYPKWPENPNKLTLEIKVVGAEGGAKAGLDSNLSPVSRPKSDIISKLPFESYGIDIFQPEKFRKMDTKPDRDKEKKRLSPFQIARSIGNSLFRNLDPVRIRRTNVGVDNTYYAIEKTPEMFETFSRSARKNKVTRIY